MMPSVVPTVPAKITAVKPTTIDTRAPKISRESTSRPSWSVPRRYLALPPVSQKVGEDRDKGNAAKNQRRDQREVPEPERRIARRRARRKGNGFGLNSHGRQLSSRMRGSITA